ncbi:hypothetical protein QR680_002451 [Steinernema hermaphroditum]|uniref:TLC domain-containing protein n=1 Tax=Steinernema hermaphroditum TaxID=289476 RepID=A0AA39H3P0_9BILA|nr:hypothetical protein QR680_002451 [Steinernema hermaphroditum]
MEALKSDVETLHEYRLAGDLRRAEVHGPYSGAELQLPPWSRLKTSEVFLPIFSYFCLFQLLRLLVRKYTWKKFSGFKQYRLRNLTVCIVHSSITGCWAISSLFLLTDPMFNHVIHWVSPIAIHLPMISIGYFAYDITDMLRHEISRWTIELLLHHVVSIFVLTSAVLSQKFILYAHWALIMEFNSIFLHIRSVMQLSGEAENNPNRYRISKILNTTTFVLCRFFVQAWQLQWAWHNYPFMHSFYTAIALFGGVFFLIINTVLFVRILAADGWLGESAQQRAAYGRDAQSGHDDSDAKNKEE